MPSFIGYKDFIFNSDDDDNLTAIKTLSFKVFINSIPFLLLSITIKSGAVIISLILDNALLYSYILENSYLCFLIWSYLSSYITIFLLRNEESSLYLFI